MVTLRGPEARSAKLVAPTDAERDTSVGRRQQKTAGPRLGTSGVCPWYHPTSQPPAGGCALCPHGASNAMRRPANGGPSVAAYWANLADPPLGARLRGLVHQPFRSRFAATAVL